MRDPHCIHCKELITHFGRGYKYSLYKHEGGWLHEKCEQAFKDNKKKINQEKQKIWSKLWFANKYENDPEFRKKHTHKKPDPEKKKEWNHNSYMKHRLEISIKRKAQRKNNPKPLTPEQRQRQREYCKKYYAKKRSQKDTENEFRLGFKW